MARFIQCTLAMTGEAVFINLENVGGLSVEQNLGTAVTLSGQTEHTYIVRETPRQILNAPQAY